MREIKNGRTPKSTPKFDYLNLHFKDKEFIKNEIVKQAEFATGLTRKELIEKYSEEKLFQVILSHVTATKKAICKSFDINIDNACRYKRELEKSELLVQSKDKIICPFSKRKAHLISCDTKEFPRLLKSNSNQLNIFDYE